MKLYIPVFSFLACLLSGCVSSIPINYIPAPTIRGVGIVTVGRFRYVPADQGRVTQDQFQQASKSIGTMHTTKPVAELIQVALTKHLIAAGYSPETDGALRIEGDVQRFLYDWVGFSEVDFYLDIDFRIIRDGVCVLEYKTSSHQKAPKTGSMAQDPEALRAAIAECFDDFLLAARRKKVL